MKNFIKILLMAIIIFTAGCQDDIETVTDETYQLEVTPATHSFPREGGRVAFTVNATKTVITISDGKTTDTNIEDAPYSVTVEGEGFSVSGNEIIAEPNDGPPRTGIVTISIDGAESIFKTINLTQMGRGEVRVSYSLEVTPESYEFPSTGGDMTFTVTALKTTTMFTSDGEIIEVIEEETPYTVTLQGEGFTLNDNVITATENTDGARTGTLTVTLDDYTLSKIIELSQAAAGYPSTSYTIDGTTLTKWNGPETIVDLSLDPVFESVTNIANTAFNSSNVETVTISRNITTIGDQAFFTSTLREFKVVEGNSIFFAIDGVLFRNGTGADEGTTFLHRFPQAKSTVGYQMPAGTTRLGNYSFAYNKELTSIEIVEGVTAINYRSFYQCSNLSSITFPSTIGNIGNNVFHGVPNFSNVYIKATTPPFIGSTNNFGANVGSATLYVPVGTLQAYKEHAQWGKFGTIVEMEF